MPAVPGTLPAIGGNGTDCEVLGCNAGSNLGVEALINPATAANLALALRFARVGSIGGAYLISGYGGYGYPYDEEPQAQPEAESQDQAPAAAPTQQPQIIVIQAAPQQDKSAPAAAAATEPSNPDIGDYALVLKNGKQLTAVAFTRRDDQLVYITHEGNRRTVNISDLDTAATKKVNEDRGTPFKLPVKADPPPKPAAKSNDASS